MISTTDPRGNVKKEDEDREDRPFTSRSRYDGEDRLIRVTDALGHTRKSSYDAAGRPRSSEDGNGSTTRYEYNDANQLLKQLDPDGRPTTYTYTAAGRQATSTDGTGDVTRYGYDPAGRLQTVISPRGNVPGADPTQFTTTYHYDFNGNLTSGSRPFPGGGTATTQTGFEPGPQSCLVGWR